MGRHFKTIPYGIITWRNIHGHYEPCVITHAWAHEISYCQGEQNKIRMNTRTLQEYLLIVLKSKNIRSDDGHTPTVKVGVDQDLCLEYKCARLLVRGII
jgi:hypothetical protein